MDLITSSLAPMNDLRARHQAVIDLICFNDQRATEFLRLYVTVALAAGAGAISAFAGDQLLTKATGWGLLASLIPLAAGCFYCLEASKSAVLNLPGRGAEFWKWAGGDEVSEQAVIQAYLENLEAKQKANNEINYRSARDLAQAKQAGIVAAMVGLVVGLIAGAIIAATVSLAAGLIAAAIVTWASASDRRSSDYPNQSAAAEEAEAVRAGVP